MTTTTDGKTWLYAVFDSDGYECSNFIGIFEEQDTALAYATEVQRLVDADWERRHRDRPKYDVNSQKIGVQPVELNRADLQSYLPYAEREGAKP